MPSKKTFASLSATVAAVALITATLATHAQTPATTTSPATPVATATTATPATEPGERIAAIKASLAQSAQNLKHYQWVETSVVNLKGEDKSTTENTCYYDVNGTLVKVPAAVAGDDSKKRGVRGKVIENKKEELGAYMTSAVALVKSYIPPDPAKIQAAKDAGKISTTPSGDGKQMRIDIKDYEKPGDTLTIQVDLASNKILGLGVASYLADAKDAVALNVNMAELPDGTQYPATVVLNAEAQQMKVTTTNSGYVKKAN